MYLNHHAPRFNPKSYPFFATKKGLDAKLAKMRVKEHPAGPFGFVLADHGTVTCTDGMRRFKFDALAPDAEVVPSRPGRRGSVDGHALLHERISTGRNSPRCVSQLLNPLRSLGHSSSDPLAVGYTRFEVNRCTARQS